LQEIPIVLQFRAVNFRPGLNKAPLCDGQGSTQALDRVHREHGGFLLVVRVMSGNVLLAFTVDAK
jgi:hypothetical protein